MFKVNGGFFQKRKDIFVLVLHGMYYETLHGFVFIDGGIWFDWICQKRLANRSEKTHVDYRLQKFLKGQYHEEIIEIYN